jgi:hypothetical protein
MRTLDMESTKLQQTAEVLQDEELRRGTHVLRGERQLLEGADCFNARRAAQYFWHLEVIDASLERCLLDVGQFLHRFATHVLKLANIVIHRRNLHLACCPCPPCLQHSFAHQARSGLPAGLGW